jgi:hypothetical protein
MGVRADPLVVAQDAEKGSISPARPQARQDALLPGPRSRVEKILNVPLGKERVSARLGGRVQ